MPRWRSCRAGTPLSLALPSPEIDRFTERLGREVEFLQGIGELASAS